MLKMGKRKSIEQQLKSKIYDQYNKGLGLKEYAKKPIKVDEHSSKKLKRLAERIEEKQDGYQKLSRHEAKKIKGQEIERRKAAGEDVSHLRKTTIEDRIFSKNSLNTHLKGVKNFAAWLKSERPEIRELKEVDREVMKEYAEHLSDLDYSGKTIETYIGAVNRVQVDIGNWSKPITAKNLGVYLDYSPRHNCKSTAVQLELDRKSIEKHNDMYTYGQAFGLRRSELVGNNSKHTYASNKSLYQHNGTIYNISIGKGGLMRVTECLKSHEGQIRAQYANDIQAMPNWIASKYDNGERFITADSKKFFNEEFKYAEKYFNTIDRSCRIHVPCRQYYAEHKLMENQEEKRFANERELKINDRVIGDKDALFISRQLGHNRAEILSHYIGRQTEFA